MLFKVKLSDFSHWNKLEKSLVSVIEDWNGTAHNVYEEGQIRIAGKTGTAQIISLSEEDLSVKEEYEDVRIDELNRDHALFISFGPVPDPKLTVVVIVENGESGSLVAAPIAKKIINYYLTQVI